MKKKLHFYHLSGTLPLKYAFLGSNLNWFLQAHVILSHVPTHIESSKYNEANDHNLDSAANEITDSIELRSCTRSLSDKRTNCKRKKVKARRFPYLKASILTASFFFRKRKRSNVKKKRPKLDKENCQFATEVEVSWSKKSSPAINETNSEPASVSWIISKYFSDCDEVASSPNFPFTPMQCRNSKKPHSEASKHKKPKVGERLVHASNSLRLTPGNRKSILSLRHYNDRESPVHRFNATVRHLAFEIADEG